MSKLNLRIVSQEKELLNKQVDSVSIPTEKGLITVLPEHIGLFAKVETGKLTYKANKSSNLVVVTAGFVNVTPDNKVIVMVDSAKDERSISLSKAKRAMEAAKETMKISRNQRELLQAEASLRLAMLEIRVAQKSKKAKL